MKITVSNPSGPINLTEDQAEYVARRLRDILLTSTDMNGIHRDHLPCLPQAIVTVEAEVTKTVSVTVPAPYKFGLTATPAAPFQVIAFPDCVTWHGPEGVRPSRPAGWWREFREGIESGNPRTYRIEWASTNLHGNGTAYITPREIIGDELCGGGYRLPASCIRSITRLPA